MTFPTDPIFYLTAIFAIVLVGLAKGGFAGLGAAAMPILALAMDPIVAAAIMLPILLAQDVVSVWAFRKAYDAPTLKLMIPGAVCGIALGWLLASSVSADGVRAVVGVIAVSFGLNRLLAPMGFSLKIRGELPKWLGAFWGGVSGFTSQVAHAGGPPFQVWALTRNFPHSIFIGTSSIFFAIVNWMKVPAFFALGQFTPENLALSIAFMPLAIFSTTAGVWLVRRLDPARFQTIISILMVLVGAELLRVSLF